MTEKHLDIQQRKKREQKNAGSRSVPGGNQDNEDRRSDATHVIDGDLMVTDGIGSEQLCLIERSLLRCSRSTGAEFDPGETVVPHLFGQPGPFLMPVRGYLIAFGWRPLTRESYQVQPAIRFDCW